MAAPERLGGPKADEGAGSGSADHFAKVRRSGLATASAPACYMPAALEGIGEGEGFLVGLHLSQMIEAPTPPTIAEERPAWPVGPSRFLWTIRGLPPRLA